MYNYLMFLLVLLKVSSQIDASQVNARPNFPLRRYLFILIQYASYVQFIWILLKYIKILLKYMYI